MTCPSGEYPNLDVGATACAPPAMCADTRYQGRLPCTFGGCTFSLDADQFLERTGSCADKSGTLYLDNRNIKGLREGVFDNMGSCT
mgnify:CR=1 FL=1